MLDLVWPAEPFDHMVGFKAPVTLPPGYLCIAYGSNVSTDVGEHSAICAFDSIVGFPD